MKSNSNILLTLKQNSI